MLCQIKGYIAVTVVVFVIVIVVVLIIIVGLLFVAVLEWTRYQA